MYASDHGSIVFAFNDNRTLSRSYDAGMLARIWLQLGAEKFKERYHFEWAPSEDLQAQVRKDYKLPPGATST
jgi:hypothetical protein